MDFPIFDVAMVVAASVLIPRRASCPMDFLQFQSSSPKARTDEVLMPRRAYCPMDMNLYEFAPPQQHILMPLRAYCHVTSTNANVFKNLVLFGS